MRNRWKLQTVAKMVGCKNLHLEPLLHPVTAAAENLTNLILAFILVLSQVFLRQETVVQK